MKLGDKLREEISPSTDDHVTLSLGELRDHVDRSLWRPDATAIGGHLHNGVFGNSDSGGSILKQKK